MSNGFWPLSNPYPFWRLADFPPFRAHLFLQEQSQQLMIGSIDSSSHVASIRYCLPTVYGHAMIKLLYRTSSVYRGCLSAHQWSGRSEPELKLGIFFQSPPQKLTAYHPQKHTLKLRNNKKNTNRGGSGTDYCGSEFNKLHWTVSTFVLGSKCVWRTVLSPGCWLFLNSLSRAAH